MKRTSLLSGLLGTFVVATATLVAEPSITATERGAVVETDRYRVELRDGVIVCC